MRNSLIRSFAVLLFLLSACLVSSGLAQEPTKERPAKYIKAAEAARDRKIADINATIDEMKKLPLDQKRKLSTDFQRLRDEITALKRNVPPVYLDLKNLKIGEIGLLPSRIVEGNVRISNDTAPQPLAIVEVRSETEAVFAVVITEYTTEEIRGTVLGTGLPSRLPTYVSHPHHTLGQEIVVRGLSPEFTKGLEKSKEKEITFISLPDVPFEVEADNTLRVLTAP